MTLGGFTMVRNGILLDYPYALAIKSMLPFCDQVVVSDCESTDGTKEHLLSWAADEPKLKVVSHEWTDPRGAGGTWFPEWINATRKHLTTDWVCYLDADECWADDAGVKIRAAAESRKAVMCHRLNFWRDAQHLCPHGENCGFEVIRVGPQGLDFPSDSPTPQSSTIERLAQRDLSIQIMHYGFLRRRDAMFRKAREVLRIWANSYDPRMEKVENSDPTKNWMEQIEGVPWINRLLPFNGTHPQIAHQWLRDRGFNP